jgi:quercetin dioxygenase-like cupin family protein
MQKTHFRSVAPDCSNPGVAIHTVIGEATGAPRFQMRVFEVEAGGSTPYHEHWWEHEVFILSSSADLMTPDGPVALQPEEAVYVPGWEHHCFRNTGDDVLRFICVIPIEQPEQLPAGVEAPHCD